MSTHKRSTVESVLNQVETSGEIAARTGYAGPTVANWPKRFDTFPAPVGRKGNATLYMTVEVDAWLKSFEDETVAAVAADIETANA